MEMNLMLSSGALRIPCILTRPDHGEIRRLVLGVHGYGGSARDEIQAGIAEEMELFSAATIRFDFPAHGDSPLGSEYLTLENCMESLLTVARQARKEFPEVEDLCIFATGFGAYVTLCVLQQLLEMPGMVKLVVQTPSVRMDETLLAMNGISRETFRVMDHVTVAAPRPFVVTYKFYEELAAHSVMVEHPIPMLILHGEHDDFIKADDLRFFHELNSDSKLVIIPGASHRFVEPGAWDMVLDLTRDWFEFERVLLSDWY